MSTHLPGSTNILALAPGMSWAPPAHIYTFAVLAPKDTEDLDACSLMRKGHGERRWEGQGKAGADPHNLERVKRS